MNDLYNTITLEEFLFRWMAAIRRYKRCYFAAFTHIVDQMTDIAVCFEFVELAMKENKYNNNVDIDICEGVNMTYLSIISIGAILLYRIVSAYSIYHLTKDVKRIFSQLLDFELFRTMYVNYVNGSIHPCNPQRWIQGLEAVFESSPQVCLLIFFYIFNFFCVCSCLYGPLSVSMMC